MSLQTSEVSKGTPIWAFLCFEPELQDWLIEHLPDEVSGAMSMYVHMRIERDVERAGGTKHARSSHARLLVIHAQTGADRVRTPLQDAGGGRAVL